MESRPTDLRDVVTLKPTRHSDHRGFLSETFRSKWFPDLTFVQDNHSLSVDAGTLRGLHFQIPPRAQDKLIRVVKGRIIDVAVDIRVGSPTFGEHIAVELSADSWEQLLVPRGFAHGFVTLEPNTEVLYKVTDYYSGEHDRGLLWNDPELGIDWRVDDPVLSERDQKHHTLGDLPEYFRM